MGRKIDREFAREESGQPRISGVGFRGSGIGVRGWCGVLHFGFRIGDFGFIWDLVPGIWDFTTLTSSPPYTLHILSVQERLALSPLLPA